MDNFISSRIFPQEKDGQSRQGLAEELTSPLDGVKAISEKNKILIEKAIRRDRYLKYSLAAFIFLFATLGLISTFLVSKNSELRNDNKSLNQKISEFQIIREKLEKENKAINEEIQKTRLEATEVTSKIEALKNENESLKANLEKVKLQVSSSAEEKHYLEEILINKNKENEKLRSESGRVIEVVTTNPVPQTPAPTEGASDLVNKIKEKDEEIRRLNEQNAILSDKLQKLYRTTNDKISEIGLAKIALEETISQAKKTLDSEWNTVNLGSIALHSNTPPPAKAQNIAVPSKSQGKVLAVNNEYGFIVIDMGRSDKITSDMRLMVKRKNDLIATLTPLEIRDTMTACNIQELTKGKKIKVNDTVFF